MHPCTTTDAQLTSVISHALGEPIPILDHPNPRLRAYQPAIDVKNAKTEFVVFADLPDIDEDELQFAWEGDTLVLSGCRDFDHDREDAEEFCRLERPYGGFEARILFDEPVDPSRATAKYKRGVLKVRLPKRQTP